MEQVTFHATEVSGQNVCLFLTESIVQASDSYLSLARLIRDARFIEADRREIAQRRGLLKAEQLQALARGTVYYGHRGRISAHEVYDQMNTCSCLTLILARIVYWQAREISRLAAVPDFPFDPALLRHVSPIEWRNVILYDEIKIDPAKPIRRDP